MSCLDFVPFWNKLHLEPPKFVALEIISNDAKNISANLSNQLSKIISSLGKQSRLHIEALLLENFINRTKRQFRQDKGFNTLQKVKRGLKNYLTIDLKSIMWELNRCCFLNKAPSKELLDWALVRLAGFMELFKYIRDSCEITFSLLRGRMKTAHVWSTAVVCMACISRIWSISKSLIAKSSVWYEKLNEFKPYLTSSGIPWLPENFELPSNLSNSLNYDIDKESNLLKQMESLSNEQPPLNEEEQSVINKIKPNKKPNVMKSNTILIKEDFGEVVSREKFQMSGQIQKKKKGKKKKTLK